MTPPLTPEQTIIVFLCLAAGIMTTRFIPFLIFRSNKKPPASILYLGGALPHAAMAMLLVYCLKDVSLFTWSHGLPEAIAAVFTAAVHWWGKNALVSMAAGTLLYMVLVQMVFL